MCLTFIGTLVVDVFAISIKKIPQRFFTVTAIIFQSQSRSLKPNRTFK